MAPMSRYRSPSGLPGEGVAAYYARRAEGGVGLIISEASLIPHPAANGYEHVPALYGDAALQQWRNVVEGVHAHGAKMFAQLWHVGSIRQNGMEPDASVAPIAPSPVLHPHYKDKGDVPKEMSQSEIDEVIQAYATGAHNAKSAGFDGVEVHGAHGYLPDQFFWRTTNQRTDQYGGDWKGRTLFSCEVLRAIRDAVGPDFPIAFRHSQWKLGAYRHKMAASPGELEQWLTPLLDAGVDIFHSSIRRFFEPEFEGSTLNLAGWTKKITGKPTITVGSVGLSQDIVRTNAGAPVAPAEIDELIVRLNENEFDLVAVGRALLADPGWAQKIQTGQVDEIIAFQQPMIDAELL